MKTNESIPYQLIIPLAIFHAEDIDSTEKLIITEIFNLFKAGNKHCYASNGHFAEMFKLERANVSYHIQKLIKYKWIISKAYKKCDIKNCPLTDKGWHRHIIGGDILSSILDSLSNKTVTPIKSDVLPYQVASHDKSNIENNIKKIEKIKNKIRESLPIMG